MAASTMAATAAISIASSKSSRLTCRPYSSLALPPAPHTTTYQPGNHASYRAPLPEPWLVQRPLHHQPRNVERTDTLGDDMEQKEEEAFRVAELRLLASAAADRADMHSILATQRDNWNKLFQNTLTATSMTGTLLAALSGVMAAAVQNSADASSLAVPAALLNFGGAAVMSVVNQFQPSQLAEEQRAATRLFKKLHNDIECSLQVAASLRQPSEVLLRDFRRRLRALDAAFPMPLTPGGLEKFPSQIRPPVFIAPLALPPRGRVMNHSRSAAAGGWDPAIEAELLGIAALVGDSDVSTYTEWAKNTVRINKGLAISAPVLAGAAGLLSLGHLGLMAALCSALAVFVSSVSNDLQLGTVIELYRNSAGHYANVKNSIEEALDVPLEERENAKLFRRRIEYESGH